MSDEIELIDFLASHGTFDKMYLDKLAKYAQEIRVLSARSDVTLFTASPLWSAAHWTSTTFRWHPTSSAPPIMGIVFEQAEKGRELFGSFVGAIGNDDTRDQIRVAIIEGDVPGQPSGYSVHIGPDPDVVKALGTMEDIVIDQTTLMMFGQVNRMYPIPGQPNLLLRFKEEYAIHREYLLAPVTKREDGQLWVDVELGIVKKTIHFRDLKDITETDIDAAALALPALITPPGSSAQ